MTDVDVAGQADNPLQSIAQGTTAWGILTILAGMLCLAVPLITTISLAMLLAIAITVAGASFLASAFSGGGTGERLLGFLLGVASLIIAALLFLNPTTGAVLLTKLIILMMLVRGLIGLAYGFQASQGRGWILLASLIDILLAFLLFRLGAATAAVVIGLYVGFSLIIWGIAIILLGRQVRKMAS